MVARYKARGEIRSIISGMTKRRVSIKEDQAQRLIASLGSGKGSDYKTWITVHDFRSIGTRVRARFARSGRFLHLLSYQEFQHFLCFSSDPHVIDIQEQFPLLPLEKTLKIAETLGVEHPGFRIGNDAIVMTTDLVVTRYVQGHPTRIPYNIKPYVKTQSSQFKRKFAIEAAYWAQEPGTQPLSVRTERDLSYEVVRSADWILQATWPFFLQEVPYEQRLRIAKDLALKADREHDMLSFLADEVDATHGLDLGTSIDVARWMFAESFWTPEPFTFPFPDRPLRLLRN